jgi:uncharacterized protein (DUF1015 family)
MPLIRPFAGLRPSPEFADKVVAPPYDVLNSKEARQRVEGRPWSFLHVSKAEIDLPTGVDPYDEAVYAKSAENFARMLAEGVLMQDKQPFYYVYRLVMGEHVQTGVVAAASVEAYDANRIRKHEYTRPDKEDDRLRQIQALNAQTGPVFLVYQAHEVVDRILADVAGGNEADLDVTADDGVRHMLWLVSDPDQADRLNRAFAGMDSLYVADGHHRSAAASRFAASREASNPAHTGEEPYNYFLSVIFPHNQMRILDYNRVVTDLSGLTEAEFLALLDESFFVESVQAPVRPQRPGEFGMYLDGNWHVLQIKPERMQHNDPVARLDISLLTANLIEPILGVSDPRRDARIDFVGGIRGLSELERRVDSGEMKVAFSLFPTRMRDLMAVADKHEVMPPKSTWFEPKLADGIVSHMLD